jgi:acyl-CoA synthetase (AMP-forming)/AMP-acid ligase II
VGTVLSNTFAGRRVLHLPDFTPDAWLEIVREEAVSSAMVVPTMLARVVEHLAGAPADAPSLRSIAYGGARMPRPILEQALTAFPDAGFVNAYGLTETSSTIALLGPDEHREAMRSDDQQRLGSVGRFVAGVQGQIRDGANVLGPGEAGELWVRGPQVSGEYLDSGDSRDDEGWFPTHDRAWIDDQGYLFVEGRSDDTIIRGGENIAPAEVEDVLLRHPAVVQAAVLGFPDEEWGERIAAFVVLVDRATASERELQEFVRSRLRSARTPDVVYFRDDLPTTPTGKLLRRELAASVTAVPA